ncbi:MAG TPA: hypothetical protein EYG03_06905 [Planctomycetes bacterium]|nr:hypothetical protein [Fuerstiella sp.]HIK91695.1 hypothetical protein [Planctomycetota bacterium]
MKEAVEVATFFRNESFRFFGEMDGGNEPSGALRDLHAKILNFHPKGITSKRLFDRNRIIGSVEDAEDLMRQMIQLGWAVQMPDRQGGLKMKPVAVGTQTYDLIPKED